MKYRLTVKGQVALATVLILLSFVAGSMLFPGKPIQPATAAVPENTQAAVPKTSVRASEPTPTAQSGLSSEELTKISAVVYFNPDQWEIQSKEIQKITDIAVALKKNAKLRIVVEGNINGVSDSRDTEFGKDLSLKRAEVVAQVLIGKGIEESRITVRSNGSSDPVTTDPEKGWMNRRTQVYVEGFAGKTP